MASTGTNQSIPEPTYAAEDFVLPANAEECDLVLKGGVTSGVVYPYAILEIAKKYRLRSIGGASAGAIAAGFAAAAEYARRNGDTGGFVRLGERCKTLPDILFKLFQPIPKLRPLFNLALAFTAKRRKGLKVFWALKGMLLAGAVLGAGLYAVLLLLAQRLGQDDAWTPVALPGLAFAIVLGAAAATIRTVRRLATVHLPEANFGICSGLSQKGFGKQPALTEWLHESIQYIAFGDAKHPEPLTFRHLQGADGAPHGIDFRAMTTNLSMQRPEVVPRIRLDLRFLETEWRKLFPKMVVDHLLTKAVVSAKSPEATQRDQAFPLLPEDGADWPVLVGVRMSLSFPGLIQAVPTHMEDRGAVVRKEAKTMALRRIWFSDGGITSNFPIHFFDALLPTRPTFAFSLDELAPAKAELPPTSAAPAEATEAADGIEDEAGQSAPSSTPTGPGRLTPEEIDARISLPQGASEGVFLPIKEVKGLDGFASSVLGSAKDWQDQAQSTLPGQRQRVVRIKLKPEEGGLNLKMEKDVSANLMLFGQRAGSKVVGEFQFDEHRWRRALVAYEQLEALTQGLRKVWPDYGVWYRANYKQFKAYTGAKGFSELEREEIADRLDGLVDGSAVMDPPLQPGKFPRPTGRLRTTPEL